jgi:hypothetical protein
MNLISLDSLFSTFNFETPDYQRGYAWTVQNVRDFWEDLSRIDAENPQHFTGTLILETTSGEKLQKAIVVDGQQRLTTAVLLFHTIAETLKGRGKTEKASAFRTKFLGSADCPKFRYAPTHDSWPYLAARIYEDHAYLAKAADHESAYTKNIETALSILHELVGDLSDDQIGRLIDKTASKLVFNVVKVDPKIFNIHVAFESINHRGKQLTKLELLKNRLIYVATLLRKPDATDSQDWAATKESLRGQINSAWSDVYSWLGRGGKEALDEEEFLRNHSIMYFDVDTGVKDWLETLLFKTVFSANRATTGEVDEASMKCYLNSLRVSAVLWSHIKRPRNMPNDQILWLNRINHVHRPIFDPVLLAAYVRLVSSAPTLATDLRKTESRDDALISVLQEIERFNVLVYLVTGRRSHTGRKDFAAIAYKLHAGLDPFAGTTEEALLYLGRYIRASVDNADPASTDSYADDAFEWWGWLDLKAFKNTITGLLRNGNGYYGHEWSKLILFEYEESLQVLTKGSKVLVPWDRVSADTVEHIYPQDDSLWLNLTEMLGGKKQKARVNSYKHSIGNLLLLSRSKNSSLQNLPYSGRDEAKAKRPRFAKGSYSETEVANQFKTWGKQSIERRGKVLLQFAEKRWKFSFSQYGITYKELLVL